MGKQKLFSITIDDCRVECIASTGGAGGQNKNRRHTAVRITHPPSGAVGFSADERDQLQNKRVAFRRMAESNAFQLWAKLECHRLSSGKSIAELVEEAMTPENIKFEVRAEGKWVDEREIPKA
jgi:protein subunit release factor A